jgi:hypothetical protein
MKLTKNHKILLDIAIKNPPNLQSRFYTLDYICRFAQDWDSFIVFSIVNNLVEINAAGWGDKQHTAFYLNETGREYRQIDHLEKAERWKERAYGFVSGVLISVLGGAILKLLLG